MNPIETVVLPLKNDAMDRAEKEARAAIADARKELAAANNDIKAVAPYPGFGAQGNYLAMLFKYKFFSAITTWRDGQSVGLHTPCFVDVDPNKVRKYIKETREHAAEHYDLFVEKLNKKIGTVQTAQLEGNHVWSYSFLRVVTSAGEKQTWKTQTIMNRSKLGKIFPQFPTRKVKD